MRFRIWHLMALTAVIAFITAELSSLQTVTVRFSSPSIPPQLPSTSFSIDNSTFPPTVTIIKAANPSPTHYWLNFETFDGREHEDGVVSTKFGYNALLNKDVSPATLSTLEGVEMKIRYRYRSLPWAPASDLQKEIAKHFEEVHPKVEWDDSRQPKGWMATG